MNASDLCRGASTASIALVIACMSCRPNPNQPAGLTAAPTATAQAVKPSTPTPSTHDFGQVAVAISKATVYSTPSKTSKVLYTVPAKEYLVERTDSRDPSWKEVLMKDGSYAYVSTKSIHPLGYQFRVPASVANADLHDPATVAARLVGEHLSANDFAEKVYGKSVADLKKEGSRVKRFEDLRPGDRVFFSRKEEVGVYESDAYFAHTSPSGVRFDWLGDRKWKDVILFANG